MVRRGLVFVAGMALLPACTLPPAPRPLAPPVGSRPTAAPTPAARPGWAPRPAPTAPSAAANPRLEPVAATQPPTAATAPAAPPAPAAATVPAPELRLEVQLAADADRLGPPALVWLRQRLHAADPFGPLVCTATTNGQLVAAVDPEPLAGPYLRARVTLDTCTIEIEGDRDGLESWTIHGQPPAGRAAALLTWLGADCERLPLVLDVAAFVANLAPAADESDPQRTLRELAAAECGQLVLKAWREGEQRLLRGRSEGGMLLPVVLAYLAGGENLAAGDALARWELLAAAARDASRDEAARQLGRYGDPRAQHALRGLLHCDDHVRLVAMESLLRSDRVETLVGLIAAASPAVAGSEELAELALQEWLPRTTPPERARVQEALQAGDSAALRERFQELGEPAKAPAVAGSEPAQAKRPGSGVLEIWLTLALTTVATLLLWRRR